MRKQISILILLWAVFLFSCQRGKEAHKEVVIPVQTFAVQPDSIASYLEMTGGLEAERDAIVYSTIPEKLVKIVKPVGSRVKKDEVIAQQDNRIWRDTFRQAKAALDAAEARYRQAKSDFERFRALHKEDAISPQQWDQIRSTMQQAEAGLMQAKAAYAQSKQQYQNTFIKAPFSGVVGSFNFDVGQMIPAGQPVARIVNGKMMKARLFIPDIHLGKVKPGQRVRGRFPNYPGEFFTGEVTRIDPAIDPLSRTFEVEAVFGNPDNRLKPGMYGQFQITTDFHRQVLVVPDNAVIVRTEIKVNPKTGATYTEPHKYVFVAENGLARLREVKTGLESHSRVEISDGLQPGDSVIVVGQKVVKNNQKIRVANNDRPDQ